MHSWRRTYPSRPSVNVNYMNSTHEIEFDCRLDKFNDYLATVVIQIEPGHGILHGGQDAALDVDTPRGICWWRAETRHQSVVEGQRQGELLQAVLELLL